MEKEVEGYSLDDLKNILSKETYNYIVGEITYKVLDFYQSKSPLNEADLNTTIADLEVKSHNIDQETKEAVINRMKDMLFTVERLYQSGGIRISSIDPEINYSTIVDIRKKQRKETLEEQLTEATNGVNEMIEEINE